MLCGLAFFHALTCWQDHLDLWPAFMHAVLMADGKPWQQLHWGAPKTILALPAVEGDWAGGPFAELFTQGPLFHNVSEAWVHMAKAYKTAFFMRQHGAPTPKRTLIISNQAKVGMLHKGRFNLKASGHTVRTTDRYEDGSGAFRFKGNRALKQSQNLDDLARCIIRKWLVRCQNINLENKDELERRIARMLPGPRVYPAGFATSMLQLIKESRNTPPHFPALAPRLAAVEARCRTATSRGVNSRTGMCGQTHPPSNPLLSGVGDTEFMPAKKNTFVHFPAAV